MKSEEMLRTDGDLLKRLMDALRPRGSAKVVVLCVDGARFMKQEFIHDCLDDLERIIRSPQRLTPLQMLALEVLMDSAYITRDEIDVTKQVPVRLSGRICYCGGCGLPYETAWGNGPVAAICPRCNPDDHQNRPVPYCPACKCVKDGDGCGCNVDEQPDEQQGVSSTGGRRWK